jgi:hypothetical protein
MLTIVGNVKNQVQCLGRPQMNINLRVVSPLDAYSLGTVGLG